MLKKKQTTKKPKIQKQQKKNRPYMYHPDYD